MYENSELDVFKDTFLLKSLIVGQLIYLEQMYTKLLSFVESYINNITMN